MTRLKIFTSAIILALLGANSASGAAKTIETLMGFTVGPEAIEFQVSSGGCTSKGSFEVSLSDEYPPTIQLNRVTPDTCESVGIQAYLPFGVKLPYSYKELGLQEGTSFILGNPIMREFRVPFVVTPHADK